MDWQLNEQGNVILPPLISYQTAVAAEMGCAMQLLIAKPGETPQTASLIVQLAMTPAQALELAEALQQMANHILQTPHQNGMAH